MYKESIDAFEKAFPLLQPRHKAYGEYLYGYGTALFHVERKSEALYCLKKASDIGYSSSPDIDTLIRDGITPSVPEIFKSEEARELERQRQAEEGRRMATLTKLLNVTDILEVDRLAKFLDLDPEECLPDWAERFKFRIRKNCVDFSNGQKDAFIAELKNDFLNWERGVEKKLKS